MSGCIYYIHCKETGKGYVGQHYLPSPELRWKQHLASINRYDLPLYYAFRKYGKEAFTIQRLCVVPLESLGNMEAYWAEQLETYLWDTPGGYNAIWCGQLGRLGITASLETCERLSESLIAYFANPESRKKRSESAKLQWDDPENLRKLSKAMSKVWADTELRDRMSKIVTKRFEDPKEREKTSRTTKKGMDNPVTRKKLSVAATGRVVGQETRDKHADSMINQWADEEARKKRIESIRKAISDPEAKKRRSEAAKIAWARRKAIAQTKED
jgi:hypothetical protein